MAAQSRRQARAAEAAGDDTTPRKRKKSLWIGLPILLVVLALAVGVGWIVARGLIVKDELEQSQRLIGEIADGADPSATLEDLSVHAYKAAQAASDPLWGAAEWIPFVGDNLKGARLAAQSLDALVNGVAAPVMRASASGGTLMATVLDVARAQSDEIGRLSAEIDAVKGSDVLVEPVRKGIEQVAEVMTPATTALEVLPSLLGGDGPRNYLLVFQNNAESLALGGSAASQTLVHVDNGEISMGDQGSSTSYRNGEAVDVPVDQSAIDLYTSYLVDHVNTSMSRPDFPTAAQIMRAWWQRDMSPDQIDGVVSVDPLALERILVATGPIQLITGDVLSSDNAVQLLLSEVYERWDSGKHPEIVDGFFAAAAGAVFDRISAGSFDLKDMLWAITDSAAQGSILVWSEDERVTAAIAGQRVSGILPTDNVDTTTVGAYFNNSNASKIDFYTATAVTAQATCSAGTGTFTVGTEISLPITQEKADSLPAYVRSGPFGTTFRDWVFVYGPPGTTLAEVSTSGANVTVLHRDIDDLGRPVVAFEAWFTPGETVSATATFTGTGQFGPLAVQTNPMIHGAEPVVDDACQG